MNAEFIAMIEYLEKEKGIKRDVLIEAVQSALLSAAKKSVEAGRNLEVVMDPKTGEIKARAQLIAVEKVNNRHDEIALSKAKALKADAKLGDEIWVDVTPKDLGRIGAQTARQAIMQRIRQAEKQMIYDEFRDRAGEIVSGIVRRFERQDVMIDLGKFEAVMPNRERVQTEDYAIGDRVRAYVVAVENTARGPEIVLSRSHPNFVRRLFETEVAEIGDRTVEIKAIAREAGHRTKVAVFSANEKVDPVGACVGMKGARVKNIVRELNNEKVDIIRWSSDVKELVMEALKPARLKSVTLNEAKKCVEVRVDNDQLSLAIGKRGQNARLTARLCGWEINIAEDTSAKDAFVASVSGAAKQLMDALGITEEIAQKLVAVGMNAVELITDVSAQDVVDATGIDLAAAEEIVNKAKSATVASQ
ncbi:transcription termination/antitermination protein NusA [Verrucomicrobiota bacterium]|nr:transcription termination/antitermination protein NusA [Verrucomicrobiota bacterium]